MKFSNDMLQITVPQTTMVRCVFEQDAVLTIILVSMQNEALACVKRGREIKFCNYYWEKFKDVLGFL